MASVQTPEELDSFYEGPDPWNYFETPDDQRRRIELLSVLPRKQYHRVLDIGCGNGFVTFSLPGDEILGIDMSSKAIQWAREAISHQSSPNRFRFECLSVFDPEILGLGKFDLIVITGVLYEQYIGKAQAVVRWNVDQLLASGGILASCHIREWARVRFPYSLLDMSLYPYRQYTHQLEIFLNDPALP